MIEPEMISYIDAQEKAHDFSQILDQVSKPKLAQRGSPQ